MKIFFKIFLFRISFINEQKWDFFKKVWLHFIFMRI